MTSNETHSGAKFNSLIPKKYAINFDLIQKELIKNGFKNPLKAYHVLGSEFENLGYTKRQQSSWFQNVDKTILATIDDMRAIVKKLPWIASSTRYITATSENAFFDLMPYFKQNTKINLLTNNKLSDKDVKLHRALHYDLSIKDIDAVYGKEHRSKPYYEIKKEMKKLGFEWQQRSGWISKTVMTEDEFAIAVNSLKVAIPNFEKVVKHCDATYLDEYWNMMPYIDKDFDKHDTKEYNYVNKATEKPETKTKLTQNELLQLNMHVRHKEIDPDVLINKKFDYDNEEYQINSIDVLDNGKDNVILERTSDGMKFKEEDFASLPDFKLHYGKDTQKASIKQKSNEKIKI